MRGYKYSVDLYWGTTTQKTVGNHWELEVCSSSMCGVNKIYRLSGSEIKGNQICSLVLGDKLLHHWNVEMWEKVLPARRNICLSGAGSTFVCIPAALSTQTHSALWAAMSLYMVHFLQPVWAQWACSVWLINSLFSGLFSDSQCGESVFESLHCSLLIQL